MSIPESIVPLLWTLIGGSGIIILGVLNIKWIQYFLKIKNAGFEKIRVQNFGNLESIIFIALETREPKIRFEISHNGIPFVEIRPELSEAETTSDVSSPGEASGQSEGAASAPGFRPNADQIVGKGRTIVAKTGALASFLGMLSRILPGKLGDSLRKQSDLTRNLQVKSGKVTQTTLSAQRKTSSLRTETRRVAAFRGGRESGGVAVQSQTPRKKPVVLEEKEPGFIPTKKRSGSSPASVYQAQTPGIPGGGSLELDLKIDSLQSRYPTNTLLYSIETAQIPVHQKIDTQIKSAFSERTFHFQHVPSWRYWLYYAANAIVIAFFLGLLLFIIKLIW